MADTLIWTIYVFQISRNSKKNKCNFFEVSSKRGLIDNLLILFDQKQRQSMNYKQLTLEKRYQISALIKAGLNQKNIALEIGVHPPTISREFKRNNFIVFWMGFYIRNWGEIIWKFIYNTYWGCNCLD